MIKITITTITLCKRYSPDEMTITSRWSESVWAMLRPLRDVAKYRAIEHEAIQRPAKLSNSTGNSVMILVYTSGALKSDYPSHDYSSKPITELAIDTKRLIILET